MPNLPMLPCPSVGVKSPNDRQERPVSDRDALVRSRKDMLIGDENSSNWT